LRAGGHSGSARISGAGSPDTAEEQGHLRAMLAEWLKKADDLYMLGDAPRGGEVAEIQRRPRRAAPDRTDQSDPLVQRKIMLLRPSG